MSSETISLTTRNQTYDKPVEKKDKNPSLEKIPSTSYSPPSSSNGPFTIEKLNLDLILYPLKSTLWKSFFNTNARALQFYNIVEELA